MHREHVGSHRLRAVTHHYPENASLEPAQHRGTVSEQTTLQCDCCSAASLLANLHLGQHHPGQHHPLIHSALLSAPRSLRGDVAAQCHTLTRTLGIALAAQSHAATHILPEAHSDAKLIPGLLRTSRPQQRNTDGHLMGLGGAAASVLLTVRGEQLTVRPCSCRQRPLERERKEKETKR